MRTFLNLFGRSPFTPLQGHMELVAACVHLLPGLFGALMAESFEEVEKIASEISESEHQADIAKDDIRSHLPRSLFMPIDRSQLLDILTLQDRIANSAEDITVSVTLTPLTVPEILVEDFMLFLRKIVECFDGAHRIIRELHDLLESSFGGLEAEKVKAMVDDVAYKEHEATLIHRRLLKSLFNTKGSVDFPTFILWQRILSDFSKIADLSEKLSNRIRMTLELK